MSRVVQSGQDAPPEENEEEKRANARRAVALAYRRLFNRDDGQIVLEDLRREFGIGRPVARPGMGLLEIGLAQGAQAAIQYLEAQRLRAEPEKRRPRLARAE